MSAVLQAVAVRLGELLGAVERERHYQDVQHAAGALVMSIEDAVRAGAGPELRRHLKNSYDSGREN
jgi:hypothetical protein